MRCLTFSYRFLAVTFTDVSIASGKYGSKVLFPFTVGFEGMGQIAALGLEESHDLTRGQPVAHLANGAFADYKVVSISSTFLLPSLHPTYMALPLSGTAALLATLPSNKPFMLGCHETGTCCSHSQCQFLQHSLIIYLFTGVSKSPLIYGSLSHNIGRALTERRFSVCIVISAHRSMICPVTIQLKPDLHIASLTAQFVVKSAGMHGLYLPRFSSEFRCAMAQPIATRDHEHISETLDMGASSADGPFVGLTDVFRAIEHLVARRSVGKIIVELSETIFEMHSINKKLFLFSQ
uniref:Alcohol dehydrogenase-like N-terminal domain-containing protein n=1 Tax=Eptatretus burgeri TaxID=7764 RepID=A0A8C4QMX0_EPTBU